MADCSSLVFSGIAPHPPIMVPEVGRESTAEVKRSIEGMAELTRRIIESQAESIILISPHAPLDPAAFVAYSGPVLVGDFADFRAPSTRIEAPLDEELLDAIKRNADADSLDIIDLSNRKLDHGTSVPLYFLLQNGWKGSVVALGYSFLPNDLHVRFGQCIRRAVDQVGRPVAFVASGDLSHRLKPEAPAGYNPVAHVFDDEVVEAINTNKPDRIIHIDPELRRMAGECGYRSLLVALGAAKELPLAGDVLTYEAPFGVGYLVAQVTNAKAQTNDPSASEETFEAEEIPKLARDAVETFVRTGEKLTRTPHLSGLLAERAACFVSLKSVDGELRGCIGTIEPTEDTLADEIIANAINACMRDPRFPPVEPEELNGLIYSVDVLSAPEPTTFERLDPRVYGVIVTDEDESRRGLLLPDIEGVDTARKQVEIAARKAGIGPTEPVNLLRFSVQRFREAKDVD
jgi:AmmeMemoRadiSam system protein A/AmmeMemoRadiSam system protein B